MTKDEALKLALEAVEQYLPYQRNEKERIAFAAINSALALVESPPPRAWVGLTEEDFSAINQSCLTKLQTATSAESILKEKNHVPNS